MYRKESVKLIINFYSKHHIVKIISLIALHHHHLLPSLLPPLLSLSLPPPLPPPLPPLPHSPPPKEPFLHDFELAAVR